MREGFFSGLIGAFLGAMVPIFFYKKQRKIDLVVNHGIESIKKLYNELINIKLYYESQYYEADFCRSFECLPKESRKSNLQHMTELSDLLIINSIRFNEKIIKKIEDFLEKYYVLCSVELAIDETNRDVIMEANKEIYNEGINDINLLLKDIKKSLKLPL